MKYRLDKELVKRGLVLTRSQAENFIKLGEVEINDRIITKPGFLVLETDRIVLKVKDQYVSRAGLKLASVAAALNLDFKGKVVLDVGSSTGGFTDYVLQHGAKKVVAVDVGTNQLHSSLRMNSKVELYEQTDIRNFAPEVRENIDIVVIDVSFISLRNVLSPISHLLSPNSYIVAMVKPQFEAGNSSLKHKGVIKNEHIRRDILKAFEVWVQSSFVVIGKADSQVAGAKGNRERFYLLRKV